MKRLTLLICLTMLSCASTPKMKSLELKTDQQRLAYFKSKRMVLQPGMPVNETWSKLVEQHDAFETNKGIIDHCSSLDPEDGNKDKRCTCRIKPACSMCDGGKVVCYANHDVANQYAIEKQRRACLESKDTQWSMYQLGKKLVYGQCSCPDNRAFAGFVKDGFIHNNPTLKQCATSRASCEHGGGTFQSPKILRTIDPKDYKARGITMGTRCGQFSVSGKWNTLIKGWKAPKTGQCTMYEIDGFIDKRRRSSRSTYRISHHCKMP